MSFKIDYLRLPRHMREGARLYIEHGVIPGRFLQAVICNDLRESFLRADDINIHRMSDIVSFFHSQAPARCWGSKERMMAWSEMGGVR